jgi:hypothetical protein
MKRLALLACGLAAAASFSLPAAAQADPPCFSQEVVDCLRPVCLLLGLDCGPK